MARRRKPSPAPVAPASGFRHGGKTYRSGELLPKQYGRLLENGQVSLDPARGVPNAPPNFGREVLEQILTFNARASVAAQVYRNPDIAYAQGAEQARIMRNHCDIMECLEARQRATALLNWHLEPEDKKDPHQQKLADDMTDIVKAIPNFTQYRIALLEALWFGRYAVQHTYGWQVIRGERRCVVKKWLPVNGDKLVFRYDDGTGKHSGDEVGIKVGLAYGRRDKIAGDRHIEVTDQGPCYFLEPWERSRLAIHKHIIEDGVYEDVLSAGRIHGVGIRDRIYWTWFQQQHVMVQLMELIQRTGSGITLYRYPAHNPQAKLDMEAVAKENEGTNVLLMPASPGDPAMDAYGIERIEPSSAGIEAMKSILHEFFGWKIKRYIVGQVRSSEPVPGGIGTSDGDLQKDTFNSIVKCDAVNLEETITRETVFHLKALNPQFAWARDIPLRFVIDTESTDSAAKLTAFKGAWDMGLRIKATDVYDAVGASMPTADDEVLQNPQLAGGGMPGQQQPGMDGQPGGEGIQASDAFGPAMGDGDAGGDEPADTTGPDGGDNPADGGAPGVPPGPDEPKGPVQYAAALSADPRWKTKHQPGETMTRGAHTYVLNEHHRWERQDKDDEAAHNADTIDANSAPKAKPDEAGAMAKLGIDPTKPKMTGEQDRKQFADKMNPGQPLLDGQDGQEPSHEERHAHVTGALAGVDPQASGLIRAFHEHPDYKSGGEVASQKLDQNHAQQLHSWLSQSAAKGDGPAIIMADGSQVKSSHVGGGIAVDFGDGRTGFASEAGSFVVGKDGKANYTSKTGIVSGAMGGKPLLQKPGGQAPTQGAPNAATPPQANPAPQAGPAGPAASPAPQANTQGVNPNGMQSPNPAASPVAQGPAPAAPASAPSAAPVPGVQLPVAHETPSAAPNVTPPANPHGDSPFAAGYNPHRENANKAHAEWQQAVQGMDAASKAGASGKDLAAWSRHVSSRRKIFREFEQAANHHDKSQKPAKAGNPAAKGPPTDEEILKEKFGIDPNRVITPTQGVDPKRPKFGSPEDKAQAAQPRAEDHAHHKALHETLSEAAANEPDDAKAASLAAQAVHHEALADHHSAAVNPPSPSQQPGGSAEAQAFGGGGDKQPPGQKIAVASDSDDDLNAAKKAMNVAVGDHLAKHGFAPHQRNIGLMQWAIMHGVVKNEKQMRDVLKSAKGLEKSKFGLEEHLRKSDELVSKLDKGTPEERRAADRALFDHQAKDWEHQGLKEAVRREWAKGQHSPAVHTAIQAAHEALHKSGLAEAPKGQGGYVPPSDEALAKLGTLGRKSAAKSPDNWKNSVKRRLVDADLHTHPRNVNAIQEAIDRGQIKSPKDLKTVLGTARDLAHGKNAIPDMEKDTHEAVKQALGRKARRKEKAPTVKPEAMLAEGAKKHGIEPEEYADLADHVWQTEAMNSPNRKPEGYADGVRALRAHSGFKSAAAAQNNDEKELSDETYMVFQEHPELGVDPNSSPQEIEDAAWDILKSDDDSGSGIPPKNSPEYWAFADDAIRQMKEHEAANPPSKEDESVPFAARWRDGYTARQYAKDGIEWTHAPKGGMTSNVNGKFYEGGEFMPVHGKSEKKPGESGKKNKPYRPNKVRDRFGNLVEVPEHHRAIESVVAGHPLKHRMLNDTALAYLGLTKKQAADLGDIWESGDAYVPREVLPESSSVKGVAPSDDWDIKKKLQEHKDKKGEEARAKDADRLKEILAEEAKHYAKKLKSTKGQTNMFGTTHGIEGAGPAPSYDEKKHSRGTGGAFRHIGAEDVHGQGKLGWDESKHPRESEGGPKGGQFAHNPAVAEKHGIDLSKLPPGTITHENHYKPIYDGGGAFSAYHPATIQPAVTVPDFGKVTLAQRDYLKSLGFETWGGSPSFTSRAGTVEVDDPVDREYADYYKEMASQYPETQKPPLDKDEWLKTRAEPSFSLENKPAPRPAGEQFENLGGKQESMFHGLNDLPGQGKMFPGMDLTSKEPLDNPQPTEAEPGPSRKFATWDPVAHQRIDWTISHRPATTSAFSGKPMPATWAANFYHFNGGKEGRSGFKSADEAEAWARKNSVPWSPEAVAASKAELAGKLGGKEPLEKEHPAGNNGGMGHDEIIAEYAAKVASGQMQHSSAKDKLKKKGIPEPGKKLAKAVEKLKGSGDAKAKFEAAAMSKAKELAESGDVHAALIAINPKISKEVLEQSPGFYDDIEQFDGDTIEEKLKDAAHRGYHDTLDHERAQEAEAEEQRQIDDERAAHEQDEAERRSEKHVRSSLVNRAAAAASESKRTKDREELRLYKADIQMLDAHDAMLKAGWEFEYQSKSGSMYYRKGEQKARLADHEVPLTPEREHDGQHGGFSWADADNQVILPVDDVSEVIRGLDDTDDGPAPSPAVPKGPEPKGDGGASNPADDAAYQRHVEQMGGVEPLSKEEWIKRRDAILAKRKVAEGEKPAAKPSPILEAHAAEAAKVPRVTNDQIESENWDTLHAGLASESTASRMAVGMKGINGEEYGIREHSPGKWQVVSRKIGGKKAAEVAKPASDDLRQKFQSQDNPHGEDAFDNKHSGERWTYGMQNRPPEFANVPKGQIHGSEKKHPGFRHGTVDYPFPLTDDEVSGFELTHVPSKKSEPAGEVKEKAAKSPAEEIAEALKDGRVEDVVKHVAKHNLKDAVKHAFDAGFPVGGMKNKGELLDKVRRMAEANTPEKRAARAKQEEIDGNNRTAKTALDNSEANHNGYLGAPITANIPEEAFKEPHKPEHKPILRKAWGDEVAKAMAKVDKDSPEGKALHEWAKTLHPTIEKSPS